MCCPFLKLKKKKTTTVYFKNTKFISTKSRLKSKHIFSNFRFFFYYIAVYKNDLLLRNTLDTDCIIHSTEMPSISHILCQHTWTSSKKFGCFKWRIFFQMLFIDMLNLLNDDHPKKIWAAKRVSWASKKKQHWKEAAAAHTAAKLRLGLRKRGYVCNCY